MFIGEILQAFYWFIDKPVLLPVTILNRNIVLSIGGLNSLPVTVSKGLSKQDTEIVPDNRPIEIALYQHS
jgi:hypothetical protein